MDYSARTPLVLNPPPNITKVVDEESAEKLFAFLEKTSTFGFDVETTPVRDFYWRRCRTKQFGNSQEQYVIDLLAFANNDPDLLYNCQGEYGKNLHLAPRIKWLIERLSKYLCSDLWIKVGVNLGFEYLIEYWNFGLRIFGLRDVMMREKCIYAGLGGQASLKNYEFYSMDQIFGRYFGFSIDKTLQESFNLDSPLSEEQYEYAALDTRTPLGILAIQDLIIAGETPSSLMKKGKPQLAAKLDRVHKQILGDNLQEICAIEDNAIGAFIDMYVHGERLDCDSWLARAKTNKEKFFEIIKKLDVIFLPLVGSKNDIVTEEMLEEAKATWKFYSEPSEEETKLKGLLRAAKKANDSVLFTQIEDEQSVLEFARKEKKEGLKKIASELGKKRTRLLNLREKCIGEALVNYESDAQLKKLLQENFKPLAKIEGLDDETLEKFNHIPVIKLIQDYHTVSKEVGTYGEAWATKWVTHPCGEEGWLHPVTGRLHCEFNQYDAATGRSSSTKPNAQNLPKDKEVRKCFINDLPDDEDEYTKITIDMSGAELRILAEEANDPIWIAAFNNDEDVHSVCTELVEGPELWHKLALPDCAYYVVKPDGTFAKKKCKCPEHNSRRDGMKPTNFGLPYGIGPKKLSVQIGKTYAQTKDLMARHRANFPYIWEYLETSGAKAKIEMKSFDMFGRRRIFEQPTWELAKEFAKEDLAKELKLEPEQAATNIETFIKVKGRKPTADERWELTHRQPTDQETSKAFQALYSMMERQGKNHRIQSGNATIIKIAMGSGSDKEGKPFLWHILPKYKAKLQKMVHDELVISVPVKFAEELALKIQDAIKRAAAMKMKKVKMESEFRIAPYWCK